MSKKRGVAGAFSQSAKNYKLGICNLICSIPAVQNPYPVYQTAKDVIELFNIFKKIVCCYGGKPLLDIFKNNNC